jgi:hypothetical protein
MPGFFLFFFFSGWPWHKNDPISKITNAKSVGKVAQVVEYLPRKCETLSSISNAHKKEKKKRSVLSRLTFRFDR